MVAAFKGGTVVAGENDEGVAGLPGRFERAEDATDGRIHAMDHGGVAGVVGFGRVLLAELAAIERDIFFGGFDVEVGLNEREVDEEGLSRFCWMMRMASSARRSALKPWTGTS
jgi:hypothetical protein